MPADFGVQSRDLADGVSLVDVRGSVDAHTFEQLEDAIHGEFKRGVYRIAVDFSKVPYISSAGAGVLIGSIGEARETEGDIVLVAPTPNVHEVFVLLGLDQVFKFADDAEKAIEILEAGG